ncbi:MAG: hypothetical protein H6757_03920 [Candidatus Omnitrophica bacterium]|nr:hypothetical protein [Candidatus Omnitrophota bacterium]
MNKKFFASTLAALMILAGTSTTASAIGMKEASSSLLLPTTGQAMNGQIGNTKTKVMAGVEVAMITTTAILGGVVGGPVIWAALGPLIANHTWSAVDAYQGAQTKINSPEVQKQIFEAQRTLEYSRQKRFGREEEQRSNIRDRIAQAAEQAK